MYWFDSEFDSELVLHLNVELALNQIFLWSVNNQTEYALIQQFDWTKALFDGTFSIDWWLFKTLIHVDQFNLLLLSCCS